MEHRTATTVEEFAANLAAVRGRIDEALGRSPHGQAVRLLPVSKTVPEDRLRLAVEAGCTELGENKVQEAHRKWQAFGPDLVSWSVIGHLQTNKAKLVAEFAREFQALDSVRVAAALDRRLQAEGRGLDVFVQVNTSGEATKFGLAPDDVEAFLAELPAFTSLRVRGLYFALITLSYGLVAEQNIFVMAPGILRIALDTPLRRLFDYLPPEDSPLPLVAESTGARVARITDSRVSLGSRPCWMMMV